MKRKQKQAKQIQVEENKNGTHHRYLNQIGAIDQ
jgi:hypothetical protein